MRIDYTSDLWWKNAVVYCLDVETYSDSDGDGVGDFRGLIDKVDYLAGLGVTCLWLMPFYPSPNRDDGYDISDYYGVDPRLGTLGDFVELVRTCGDRGIRIIVDLVVNHPSDEHPWFTESRSSTDNARRDWYVWRAEPADEPADIAFPDKETSNWELDRRTGEYYLHRFYRFQPDLNIATPAVRDEICKIAAFWLALGASGFRMDAVPFVLELEGIGDHGQGDARGWLPMLRRFVSRRDGEALLLGEVNTAMKDLSSYFGSDGDALHMEFAFLLNQSLWLSLARGAARAARPRGAARAGDQLAAGRAARQRVGDVPAQPRRADARQAHDHAARRGVPRVRPEARHADVRPRPAPPDGGDAGRRRGAAAHGVEPHVLAAGDARRLHGRRDRHGRAAEDPRPLRGPRADALDRRAQRWLLERKAGRPRAAAARRCVRAREGERRGPASRPGFAAAFCAPPHPRAARGARARLGYLDADRDRAPRGLRAPVRLGGQHGDRDPQPRRSAGERGARARRRGEGRARPARRLRGARAAGTADGRARRLRRALAARAPVTADVRDLQAFLRMSAGHGRTVHRSGPFTVTIHPRDPLRYLNYAIPDDGTEPDAASIDALRRVFRAHERRPRLEWIEEAAPAVAGGPGGGGRAPRGGGVLAAAGMTQELRTPLMTCGPDELVEAAADVPGLAVAPVGDGDLWNCARVLRPASGQPPLPADEPPSDPRRGGGGAVLARVDGA